MLESQGTTIGTLKVRGTDADGPALRLAISHQLESADFTSPELSPSAILVVRRFSDPLPRRLAAERGLVGVDGGWERSAQAALSDLYRRAERPNQGLLTGDPEAVLFGDEAELLACLALDVSHGNALTHWWWQVYLKSMPLWLGRSHCVKKILCDRPRYIPSVFSLLNGWGKVLPFLQAMERNDTFAVLQAMADTHALGIFATGLQAALHDSARNSAGQKSASPTQQSLEMAHPKTAGPDDSFVQPFEEANYSAPWRRIIGQVVPVEILPIEQAALLGIALSLYKAPNLVRRVAFQEEVLDWWRLQENFTLNKAVKRQNVNSVRQQQEKPFKTKLSQAVETQTGDIRKNPAIERPYPEDRHEPEAENAEHLHITHEIFVEDQSVTSSIEEVPQDFAEMRVDRSTESFPLSDFGSESIRTGLGGVLYLINLMQQLKLPECFESDWYLASQLGSWGTLEALARALLSNADTEWLNDPLWHALARLDNREPGVLPGNRFMGAIRYYLPPTWWALLSEQEKPMVFWATRKKQLRIWSDLGFVLVDRSEQNNVTKDYISTTLHPYFKSVRSVKVLRCAYSDAPVNHFKTPCLEGMSSTLLDWLALVVPFIRFYLASTLHPGSKDISELGKSVFTYPGNLYVTSCHVDLIMTLDSISLPIRRAGMDCNPGWLADFGRVISFHFD